MERDDYVKFHIAIFFISTHTLTWSVTLSPRPVQSTSLIISTHTLTWSVTDAAPE